MELTKWDVTFTVSMVLAVFLMTIVFPYAGLAAGDPAEASDIPTPEFREWGDLGVDKYNRPDKPLASNENRVDVYEGGLKDLTLWTSNSSAIQPEQSLSLSLEIYGYSNLTEAVLVLENDTNLTQKSVSFYGDEVGATKTANIDDDYIIDVTLEEYEDNATDGKDRYQIRTNVVEVYGESSEGFLSWVGNVTLGVGKVLLFIGQVIIWGIQALIGFLVNAAQAGSMAAMYVVEVSIWLLGGYYSIITVSNGWVLGILSIPLIAIGYEAIKLTIIVIGVLPTT